MEEVVPVGSRYHVLDGNIDDCNIVPENLYRDLVDRTCKVLIDACGDHCGPKATYAILEELGPDRLQFSKDGMDIINSISFVNKTQDTIRRLLSYCAANSDRIVGDGTTSAMIISLEVLRAVNTVMRNYENSGNVMSYYELRTMYDQFVEMYLNSAEGVIELDTICSSVESKLIDNYSIDIPRDEIRTIVIYYIAYTQAFISSHGDKELAHAVATLFSSTPEESWDHIFFKRSVFETEERFKVDYTKDQFVTHAKVMNKSMLNSSIGGRLRFSNATLIPFAHPILATHQKYFKILCEIIRDHVINKKELLVIHSGLLDDVTTNSINTVFEELKDQNKYNTTVAILRHDPLMEEMNDITVLSFLCKKMPTSVDEQFHIFTGVQVEFDQFTLRLNGLYSNPENSIVHPYYNDPSFPLFKDCAEYIKEKLEQYKTSGPTYTKKDDIMNFHELYHKMKYTSRVVITVGGQKHDSTSAIPVIKDAIYATRSSLQKGIELGAAMGIVAKCLPITKENDSSDDCVMNFPLIYLNAVRTLHSNIYKTDFQNKLKNGLKNGCLYDLYTKKVVTLGSISEIISEGIRSKVIKAADMTVVDVRLCKDWIEDNIVVIQPRLINDTIVKRFGDLFLRMVNSSKIISVGGVICNSNSKTQ